jgi:hypothetical protein
MSQAAVSHALVLAFAENIAAYIAAIQRNQEDTDRLLAAIRGYIALIHDSPAIRAGNTRIARRKLAELLGERED